MSVSAFSIGIIVQKGLTERYSAADVVVLQFAAASVLMWLICARLGYLPRKLSEFLPAVMWGCLTPGCVFLFASAGAQRTDGISVVLIWGLMPLIGPFLGRLFLGEKFHWSLPVGALVAFGGLFVLTSDRQALGTGDMTGNILVVAGVFSAAVGQIFGRQLNTSGAPWFRIATLQITGATLISLVVALFDGNLTMLNSNDREAFISIAYLVVGMTMINFIGYNLALSRIQIAWIAFYSALSPVLGTVTAGILLGELIRPFDVLGIVIIVSGVAIPHVLRIHRSRADR
jgi:drug/metabolite transporter (DMT)-like permease